MDTLEVTSEQPDTADVRALLERHFALMRSLSPAESCHVMAPETLLDAGATLLGLREAGVLLGVGALTRIGDDAGELKSMHTAQEARGKGVARRLLQALMQEARDQGMSRISLETGSAAEFQAARNLYAAEGFETCAPFGDYQLDPLSAFMTRTL
ncbi:GNAT family N-acetyltransferase [Sulfitobacter mediterraneus]|uniref:GCN5 family acetyltransferase n=1 Tax=Sulfitobacter mediterraneus TaxID=83219 RepID=A0A061STA7_9RHOB|nr:GNAT family N-acetyltransferase [Sulfitobacter mediterraneus]KAJ04112.1 GCN5 family acetyltransferase [Sulfitobacter mediterraneus]